VGGSRRILYRGRGESKKGGEKSSSLPQLIKKKSQSQHQFPLYRSYNWKAHKDKKRKADIQKGEQGEKGTESLEKCRRVVLLPRQRTGGRVQKKVGKEGST